MRERPIIFNAEMVRAVLDGRKTQTRRIIQSPAKNMQARGHEVISHRAAGDKWYGDYVYSMRDRSGVWQDFTNDQFLAKCPFGAVGDRLWVRETWARYNIDQNSHDMAYRATIPDDWPKEGRWRPSIHMPRWASRITLEITGVRVERLHAITLGDICKELGCGLYDFRPATYGFKVWEELWQSIYGADSWQANPWVWGVEFKRVEGDQ